MSQSTFYDTVNQEFVITKEFCESCHISRDGAGREGVTPYAVACYVYHLLHTLRKTPTEVNYVLMNHWDKPYWGNSDIHINTWNHLFNKQPLSSEEWESIKIDANYIDTIKTALSSTGKPPICHVMTFPAKHDCKDIFICSEESYRKFVHTGSSEKGTFYRYGAHQGRNSLVDICEGLRTEVVKATIPFDV